MKKPTSKYTTLIFLVFLFAAPGIAAYLFYSHPTWLGSSRTNKGTLLTHPVELASLPKKDKWRVLLWSPGLCDATCLQQLDKLARVRLALGRKLYLVDQMLVLAHEAPEQAALAEDLKARDFLVQSLSLKDQQQLEQLTKEAQIYIMDPDNYLVLSYDSSAKPDDIYKDLKLLLTTYETKKG